MTEKTIMIIASQQCWLPEMKWWSDCHGFGKCQNQAMQSVLKQIVALIDWLCFWDQTNGTLSSYIQCLIHCLILVLWSKKCHIKVWHLWHLFTMFYTFQVVTRLCVCVFLLYACTHGCECMRKQKWNRQIHQTSTGFWFVSHQEHPLTENKCLMP